MISGFPCELVSDLRCMHDGAELQPGPECRTGDEGRVIVHGSLRCTRCNAAFAIDDGILNMLEGNSLDADSRREIQLRNEHAEMVKKTGLDWWENNGNRMEIIPTLEALAASPDKKVLELGCGDGRYTVHFAGQSRSVLAIDFSVESLRILQHRHQELRNVGLVLGDITTMKLPTACFDRVFSTLVSNLPTREHRNAMYRLAGRALRPEGRFVFSTHHHGIRQILASEEKSGLYRQGGIYRYNFTVGECRREVSPYFESVDAGPIQVHFPFARTLRLPVVALSRISERIPFLNRLGMLILCIAEKPLR